MSLIEVVVAVAVLAIVVVGALGIFDAANRVTVSQSQVADLQGVHRSAHRELVRLAAEAGLGGLPLTVPPARAGSAAPDGVFPDGLAIASVDQVPDGYEIAGDPALPVVAGSDVLVVRGVLTGRVHVVEPEAELVLDPNGRVAVTLDTDVDLGVTQDLEAFRARLATAIAEARPEAVVVRDRYNPGAYAVMELDPAASNAGSAGGTLTVGLVLGPGGTRTAVYGRLTLGTVLLPGAAGTTVTLPDADSTVVQLPARIGSLGFLDELWLYLREDHEIPGDDTSRPTPWLARAQLYPGTSLLHPAGSTDIAPGLIDLQVAFGVDLPPGDGVVVDGGTSGAGDEVLYNHPDDDDGIGNGGGVPGTMRWAQPGARLAFVRLSTIAQAALPDRSFPPQPLRTVENHDLAGSRWTVGAAAQVRKQLLATVVEPRNLP